MIADRYIVGLGMLIRADRGSRSSSAASCFEILCAGRRPFRLRAADETHAALCTRAIIPPGARYVVEADDVQLATVFVDADGTLGRRARYEIDATNRGGSTAWVDVGERLVDKAIDAAVPEVAVAISQPIQMRQNELLAGALSDVAAQIYGPNLDQLQKLGDHVADVIRTVSGAADVRAAQAGGLRYLRIIPDRTRLARYGLTVEDVNLVTEMTAVGRRTGVVFEGDRRFDLVAKLTPLTANLDAIRALPLKSSTGQVVPLGDVADVRIETGPSLVNRDQQSRRLTVEFNVRGRDLVSVVNDAQRAVADAVSLPVGYRIEWGGEFENYLAARKRLAVVVPLALALILFMLWLAFHAVKPAILIFLNIPFSVVGGVVALWLRGIPFSISAGVGFIALFGVAVLNGLVLVSFCRHLEFQGQPAHEAIQNSAELRLRPVLMTALVAALGFLPMALSTAPGSEVQRPLATVVIGGLVTATLLTLLLFPSVYSVAHRRSNRDA